MMNSRYRSSLESDEFGGFENYRKSEQLLRAKAFQHDQNLDDSSFPDRMYEFTIGPPTPKASAAINSSRSPTSRYVRKSQFKPAAKQHHISAEALPLNMCRRKLKPNGLHLKCASPCSEFIPLELPRRCLNETICDDSECEIPPCTEPGCDWDDVIVCVDGNNCDASAACKKDCLSLKTTRPNSPSGEWSSSEITNMDNFTPGNPYTNSLVSYLNAAGSPTPATPLLSNHPSTIYSQTELPTPKGPFSPLNSHKDQSELFNAERSLPQDSSTCNILDQSWYNNGHPPEISDESFVFQCPWLDCSRVIESGEQWNQHLHQEHIDPQMVYNCPIQENTCPENMTTNPLAHLQNDHGFEFSPNGNGYRCPSGSCQQGVEAFDPSSFHNHLDHFHATPYSGQLQCQLWACGNWFDDPNELISHAKQNHTIPVWNKPVQGHSVSCGLTDIPPKLDRQSQLQQFSKESTNTMNIRKLKETLAPRHRVRSKDNDCKSTDHSIKKATTESEKTPIHQCNWNISNSQETICGMHFRSENELHLHIKETHLECLDNKSGYYCRWIGCTRESRLGPKSGFSQRGKLERHMATHTNFKCSTCDICGSSFSAPQAMRQHRRLHTGERPWKCKHCSKTFTQQSACTVHERTHTNEKPLECPICFKKFSESSNLTKHRKTHGEKGAHACSFPDCDKTFHRFDQLKRHLLAHAKNKNFVDSYKRIGCSIKRD